MSEQEDSNKKSAEAGGATQARFSVTEISDLVRLDTQVKNLTTVVISIAVAVIFVFLVDFAAQVVSRADNHDSEVRYSEMYTKYTNENRELLNEIRALELKMMELENSLEVLRARNTYLR